MLELADETDSKSVGSDPVWVQVPPPAPPVIKKCPRFARAFLNYRVGCFTRFAGETPQRNVLGVDPLLMNDALINFLVTMLHRLYKSPCANEPPRFALSAQTGAVH